MKNHTHTYDEYGKITCCSLEEKINSKTSQTINKNKDKHIEADENAHAHNHEHDHSVSSGWKSYIPCLASFILLSLGLGFEHLLHLNYFSGSIKVIWYFTAYLPVGIPVIKEAWGSLKKGEIFTEFFLMTLATIGAFAIGEYPEAVTVMLFYSIGELFQTAAVLKAKGNIQALLDVRPKIAAVSRNGQFINTNPESVSIGENILVKSGEKIPLDGILISEEAQVNTAAISGESMPQQLYKGDKIYAGSINLEGPIELKVNKIFSDSSIARILELVQNATSRKSKTELLIRRLAKIYTPIVVYLALAICFIPFFFVEGYVFTEWLYRALIFLVISCPCALVISIPLGYFGGLGAASKHGLLFKGANFLDQLTKVNTLIFDKTGTVTNGEFKISSIELANGIGKENFLTYLLALETKSTHPIAKAIVKYPFEHQIPEARNIKEYKGKGLTGIIDDKMVIVGNRRLMNDHMISLPSHKEELQKSVIYLALDGKYAGLISLNDEIRLDAADTIKRLRKDGIHSISMLSGDKDTITKEIGKELNLDNAIGGLLPEDKLEFIEEMKTDQDKVIAFVGDGINDAPALASSHVGIAMGGLGSDVAIETADIVIQTDQLLKISTGIKIAKSTHHIIYQNIAMAFLVKLVVMILGAAGMATLWEAIFADVGVALLAILNAVRLQRMKWN